MTNRWLILSCLGLSACAHTFIEGTRIRDTPDNRAVYETIGKVRQSLQERDATTLLSLVSPRYFEDNGTHDPSDDFGYTELQEKLVKDSLDSAKEVYLSFDIHEVVVRDDYAYADIRYNTRTRLELPAGRIWDTHSDFDRIELEREEGTWKVISGL